MRQIIIYHAKKHISFLALFLTASSVCILATCLAVMIVPSQPSPSAAVAASGFLFKQDISVPQTSSQKVNQTQKSFVDHEIGRFLQYLDGRRHDPRNKLQIRSQIVYQGRAIISIRYVVVYHTPGEPIIAATHLKSYNYKSGVEYAMSSLFTGQDKASQRIGGLLIAYFKQEKAVLTPKQLLSLANIDIDNREMYLTDNSIVFSIDISDPSAGRSPSGIAIHRSLLTEVLKGEYRHTSGVDEGIARFVVNHEPKKSINPSGKLLALTFDDGPGLYTEKILNALDRYGASGTFFVIGRQVADKPDVMRRMVRGGHEIGNHSWAHPSLPALSHERLAQEINDTQRSIESATGGYTPVLMRPPYGSTNLRVQQFLIERQLKVTLWNIDTEDWHTRDSRHIYDHIVTAAADGGIVLLHDIYPSSAEAVERAIPDLIDHGYQLVTVSELMQHRQ